MGKSCCGANAVVTGHCNFAWLAWVWANAHEPKVAYPLQQQAAARIRKIQGARQANLEQRPDTLCLTRCLEEGSTCLARSFQPFKSAS